MSSKHHLLNALSVFTPNSDAEKTSLSEKFKHSHINEIGPTPQSNVEGNQCQRIDEEEVNPLANGVDSIDDHIDKSVEESNARNSRGRRNAKPWIVDVIEADGTIKPSNMTVAQAMKPLHGTKVVL
ncbi:hypothetical protein PIB30_033130 [Stylosanthes scabra]|uniref:Uncharacterized protein n=1 Tax=Stylosanthes scabra TaxID=79078 RepID=A0ABU6VB98_9FABA|nr:hypothetical protein [Stylosanthes scabra]